MIDRSKSHRAAFVWLGLALFPLHVRADSVKLERLRVYPEAIELSTARDRQSILVQAEYADGSTREVTAVASSTVEPPVASVQGGIVAPISDGQGRLKVAPYSGIDAEKCPVVVRRAAAIEPLRFRNDVVPVFTKAGCNTGKCHGSASGKDGFRLSLFGYDPAGDHGRLTREVVGRRINLASPDDCLLLNKATGRVSHTGGKRIEPGSENCQILLRWLEDGAPADRAEAVAPIGIEVFPARAVFAAPGEAQRIVVRARFSDGTDRDVTRFTIFLSNNDAAVTVDEQGFATGKGPGEAFILARFDKFTSGVSFIVRPGTDFRSPGTPSVNYIDTLVHAKLDRLNIVPSEVCSDETFFRRAYIDLIGLLPTSADRAKFLADANSKKRLELVEGLLARSEFLDIWVMRWAELLQMRTANGLSPKGLQRYDAWLRDKVGAGVTIDKIAHELLAATGGSFDNPAVSYFQTETTPSLIAENVAQVFLGTRIQCAQCHNHPFDRWTLDDYYGFASFFSRIGYKQAQDPRELLVFNTEVGEMVHPIAGQTVTPTFLGSTSPKLKSGQDFRQSLADWLASPENPAFARNLANIVWSHFMGQGIVEPIDDARVSNPPSNPELLDALARRLVEFKFDIKPLIREILASRTYQLSTGRNESNRWDERNFSHQKIRRMRAEVLLDCISEATATSDRFPGLGQACSRCANPGRPRSQLLFDHFRPIEPRKGVLVRSQDHAHAISGTPPDQRRNNIRQDHRGKGRGERSSPNSANLTWLRRRSTFGACRGPRLPWKQRRSHQDWPDLVTRPRPSQTYFGHCSIQMNLCSITAGVRSDRTMVFRLTTVAAGVMAILFASTLCAQDGKPALALSFERDVRPILRKRCGNCHNAERPRGELDLMTYFGVVAGGASGKVAVAGKPEDSPIYTQPAHLEDPKMPPNAPKIPQREIDVLRRWIEGGLIEKAGDSPSTGDAPAPEASAETLVAPDIPPRGTAISALAVSPVAPLAAVSGHRQVFVFDLEGRKLLGALPFPEGDVFCLKFSKDGQTLLAAGGQGAESGKVVLFQTKTWARGSTVGDEVDVVLAADLAPDQSRVVLGGPNRAVKVVANPKGEILHNFRKPTDWVTVTSFSPDGLLVAAGDRFGGLFLWETRSGQEFLALGGHPKSITAISWNSDGDGLLTAGEDGAIQFFNLNTGKLVRRWEAHAGGVLWIEVHRSGRIASSGRDRRIKVWEPDGKLVFNLGPALDQATRVAWTADGRSVVSGDLSGEVRVWTLADSVSMTLPLPLAARPAAIALVDPVLTPAQPFVRKPAAITSKAIHPDVLTSRDENLESALASARDAVASAERTVATLTKLSGSRLPGFDQSSSAADALRSANLALMALHAALAADPGNSALEGALAETQRAVNLLERNPKGRNTTAGSTRK